MKEDIFIVPDLLYFDKSWENLQKYLKSRGNPPWKYMGNLDLNKTRIESLGNLISVGGHFDLYFSTIKSLGNLVSVGRHLDLEDTPIESLGNLQSVGGDLDLRGTPISKKYTAKEIRKMIKIGGKIYM